MNELGTEKEVGKKIAVAARMFEEVFHGIIQPINIWVPYLEARDVTPAQRDIAFVVLLVCMRDVVEARTKRLNKIRDAARATNRSSIFYSIPAFEQVCEMPLAVFNQLTEREQVLMYLVRDRIVHGYLDGPTNETRKIKVVRNGKVKSEPFLKADIERIVGEGDEVGSKQISPLRERVSPSIFSYANRARTLNENLRKAGGLKKLIESGAVFFPDT